VKKVALSTDGACIGNPGPGGWACVLRFGAVKKELFGFDLRTTNNRMELMAGIQGLLALKEPCEVEVTTDSEYVLHGITKWILKWKQRHWWRKQEPIRNADLWMELDALVALHKTSWVWTRGHAGHEDNTRCDWLAENAAATQRSSWPDNRPHAALRLNLGPDYVPPKPQADLFEEIDGADDEDGDEAAAGLNE
jgi:ribonuclease HI